jgi:hypothetical protein
MSNGDKSANLSASLAALARDIKATKQGINTNKRIAGLRDVLNELAQIMK